MAGFRSQQQDVFWYDTAMPTNTSREPNIKDNKPSCSLGSLTVLEVKTPLNTVGSRKPLSYSEAEALDNILPNGPFPLKSCHKSHESGYFSVSSKLSLQCKTTLESWKEQNGININGDDMDKFNKEWLESLLNEIAEEFGACWKELGRHLLRKECSIQNIDADYSKVSEKSYQMLRKWFDEKGACKASITDIFKCLIHIGEEEVAEKILAYLPDPIERECELILLTSPKRIRSLSMTTPIYNITEQYRDLKVEKQLRLQENEEVYVCSSNNTRKRYLLKEIEESPKVYRWAARLVIPEKQLIMKMKNLRNTSDFLKDLQLKEETIGRLKGVTETLQEKLHIKHMVFCQVELKCTNCEKTALMRELLDKDLSLLHHELVNMIRGNRRLSVSGIPTERILDLAERAYAVCEEHKKFHEQIVKLPRRCSMELLNSDNTGTETELDKFDDPLQCTLNILRRLGRRRKVVQSLTMKERKRQTKRVQRHSSEKTKSRFYVPSQRYDLDAQEDQETTPRSNWPIRMGSKIFGQRKRSTEKKERRKSSEKKNEPDKGNKTLDSQLSCQRPQGAQGSGETPRGEQRFHPRSNTFPSSLADINDNTTSCIYGPQELCLDDIDDSVGSVFSCMRDLRISERSSRIPEDEIHMSSSDSNLRMLASRRKDVMRNPLITGRSPGVFEILTQKKFLESRQRSFSDDGVMQVRQRYQVYEYDDSNGQKTPSSNDVMWTTEIDPDTIFFV